MGTKNLQNKLIRKLAALNELAQRGEGGEQVNAARMLQKLLDKYDMTLDDIESEEVLLYHWNYNNKQEATLLIHVVAKATNQSSVTYHKGDRKYFFHLTPSQYLEVDLMYAEYKRALKRHLERAFNAFIQANDIYGGEASSDTVLSEEEIAEWLMTRKMANDIEPTQIRKQLPGK